jgi:serine/threonine protein kinase
MTPERWQEIEAVFQEALEQPVPERAAFLDQACTGDEELKQEATTLIAAYDEAGAFIEQPAMAHDAHVLLGRNPDRNLGLEIGPYRIIERLGAGGMAEVFLAHDTRLNRLVALKLLPPYFASDESRLRRFQSEARAASALNHPNILTIHEVGENAGVYFIATEFIDGQTIRELIRNESLSLEEVLDVVEQVASALAVAHTTGIVHRDIKPENIMQRRDGLVKILDFGIAKLLEPETPDRLNDTKGFRTHTEAGLVMGTAHYMSPEQARALQVDKRTDIWSLGVVLYELLAGRLPFSGATRMDTMVAVLDREPAPLSQVANEFYLSAPLLQSIVDRCLSKETTQRYQTAGELLADLKNAREQLDSGVPAIDHGERNSRVPAKASSRFAWTMLALVALLIVVTSGTLLYKQSLPAVGPKTSETTAVPARLYLQMSEREQLDFIATQGQRISAMMSERPEKLNDDAVRVIKAYVARDLARLNQPSRTGSEPMGAVYERARPYVPVIARSFAARKVPIVIGIYLPVIESAYHECLESDLGARGLFQFLPATAKHYGVAGEEMCDVQKMSAAAAHYIADRMAELGEDSGSVTLVLLSYNRGEQWVRDTLRQLRGTENYERNFWTLLANHDTLDEDFRKETAGYVPSFFAAAIIGENPAAFGLQTPPLSTLSSAADERR